MLTKKSAVGTEPTATKKQRETEIFTTPFYFTSRSLFSQVYVYKMQRNICTIGGER